MAVSCHGGRGLNPKKVIMRSPMIPKGRAMALHLTKEFQDAMISESDQNPYDFWNQYEQHYAWDMGKQKRKSG